MRAFVGIPAEFPGPLAALNPDDANNTASQYLFEKPLLSYFLGFEVYLLTSLIRVEEESREISSLIDRRM